MLTRLLTVLEEHQGGLRLEELGARLGVQPSALAGMIELLARKGRLIEVGPDGGFCAACDLRGECNLLAGQRTRYVVVPRRKTVT
jgi:hypothetical protein